MSPFVDDPIGTRRVLRYQVPIDDREHRLDLPAGFAVLRVATVAGIWRCVEFWMEHPAGAPATARTFRVYGTGQPITRGGAEWRGTAERTPEGLVWHLYELPGAQPSITCPQCGRTSHHPSDVEHGYCGACHDFTSPGARTRPPFDEGQPPATHIQGTDRHA